MGAEVLGTHKNKASSEHKQVLLLCFCSAAQVLPSNSPCETPGPKRGVPEHSRQSTSGNNQCLQPETSRRCLSSAGKNIYQFATSKHYIQPGSDGICAPSITGSQEPRAPWSLTPRQAVRPLIPLPMTPGDPRGCCWQLHEAPAPTVG